MPPTSVKLKETSFVRRGESNIWSVNVFFGCQDKNVHMTSLSISFDEKASNVSIKENNFAKFSGHSDHVRQLALHDDVMVSCSDDGTLRLWEAGSFAFDTVMCKKDVGFHSHNVLAVVMDDQIVISGGKDRKVIMWDYKHTKKSKGPLTLEVLTPSIVYSIAHFNNQIYVGGADGHLRAYKIDKTITPLFQEKVGDGKVICVEVYGNNLLAVGSCGTFKVYSLN